VPTLPLLRPILVGGFLAGTLDIAAAFAQGASRGTSPTRVLQAIASGVMGRSAFEGGWTTALLGLELHFIIALGAATTFVVLARSWPILRKHWALVGPVYGIGVWAAMAFVIVPLSATPWTPQRTLNGMAMMILIHITCVGIPIAWAARPRSAATGR
jgi:uncharacterized membrane protein YagU involved in acid resistance